ncbi:MAG: sulfatase [Rhodothermales bacterium]
MPRFVILFVALFLALPAAAQRPNIVFILADDLGYSDLGAYGNPFNETPRIDSLARMGMRFTQAYVASPICSPSRAAIMTGRHPARLHLTNYLVGLRTDPSSNLDPAPFQHYLAPGETTLAEMLREAGYNTGIVGKWHLGGADSVSAHAQGFEYDRIISKNGLDYYNYSISSRNETVFEDDGTHYITDRLTDYAVDFIDQQTADKPFFLYVPYSAPHVLIVPRGDKLRPFLFKYNAFGGRYNPYYAALLESLDDGVGRILDALAANGLDENTLVVFTSDNGGLGIDELGPTPTFNDPLRAWKGFVYEGGARIPYIVRWPGHIDAGTTNDHYITGTDHLPTFMDILGVHDFPRPLDGISYLATLRDASAPFDRGPIYWHYPHFSNQTSRPAGAMRLGDFKLVEHYETGALELYDLSVDVGENVDVSRHFPEKTAAMHAMLRAWRAEVDATMPLTR